MADAVGTFLEDGEEAVNHLAGGDARGVYTNIHCCDCIAAPIFHRDGDGAQAELEFLVGQSEAI